MSGLIYVAVFEITVLINKTVEDQVKALKIAGTWRSYLTEAYEAMKLYLSLHEYEIYTYAFKIICYLFMIIV